MRRRTFTDAPASYVDGGLDATDGRLDGRHQPLGKIVVEEAGREEEAGDCGEDGEMTQRQVHVQIHTTPQHCESPEKYTPHIIAFHKKI